MVLVQNNSNRDFKVVYQDKEYLLPVREVAEIPEIAAKLYFAYGMDDINERIVKWCCERMRFANPGFTHMSDKDIWDNLICKVIFGKDILKKKQIPPQIS